MKYRKMLLLFWELCEEHAAKKQQQIPKKILQITVEVKRILRFSIFIIPPLPFTSDIPQFCKHVLLSFYYNWNFYTVYRELPGGKGFADLVFVPRKRYQDKPALVVELKWDKNSRGCACAD